MNLTAFIRSFCFGKVFPPRFQEYCVTHSSLVVDHRFRLKHFFRILSNLRPKHPDRLALTLHARQLRMALL
jgi:hypothetical protein